MHILVFGADMITKMITYKFIIKKKCIKVGIKDKIQTNDHNVIHNMYYLYT